jgi:hypothetical protein
LPGGEQGHAGRGGESAGQHSPPPLFSSGDPDRSRGRCQHGRRRGVSRHFISTQRTVNPPLLFDRLSASRTLRPMGFEASRVCGA